MGRYSGRTRAGVKTEHHILEWVAIEKISPDGKSLPERKCIAQIDQTSRKHGTKYERLKEKSITPGNEAPHRRLAEGWRVRVSTGFLRPKSRCPVFIRFTLFKCD